nr:uncharacterized protein CTRU02_00918 [Colletotrichum truncatum]KAF6800513.1 hypothetical protein CTRU02_00918 [Colletotrichum truncatum]
MCLFVVSARTLQSGKQLLRAGRSRWRGGILKRVSFYVSSSRLLQPAKLASSLSSCLNPADIPFKNIAATLGFCGRGRFVEEMTPAFVLPPVPPDIQYIDPSARAELI